MKPANRIVYNTGILYARLIIATVIGLFSTRLILDALGEINFGIYVLVGGVVGLLEIMNSSMAGASMRFMSFSLGTEDKYRVLKTFNTTLLLHIIIGAILIIFIEIGGYLAFEYILKIPEEKLFDAKVVFHFMVVTTFISIISVPYDAVINSHENLLALSIIDLFGTILRLVTAIFLTQYDGNLLITYGFLMLVIQLLLRLIKQWYSRINYDECNINFRNNFDKYLAKEILIFSGWNLLGSLASVSVIQIKGIIMNMFFGVTINAANGISKTASQKVNMVSVSMTKALNPQLVKSEGIGNRERMLRLTEVATKFSVFLFSLIAIPVILEAEYLLSLWLKSVPEYAVIFCQLTLLGLFLEKFSFEITNAIRAVGKIKNFQVSETILVLTTLPVSYVALYIGYPPPSVFVINLIMAIIAFFLRLYFGKIVANMNINLFFQNGIIPILLPILLALFSSIIIQLLLPQGFIRMILILLFSCLILIVSFWNFGLKKEENGKLKQMANTAFKRLF